MQFNPFPSGHDSNLHNSCKQFGSISDCSHDQVFILFASMIILSEMHLRICSRCKKQEKKLEG